MLLVLYVERKKMVGKKKKKKLLKYNNIAMAIICTVERTCGMRCNITAIRTVENLCYEVTLYNLTVTLIISVVERTWL